MRKFLILWSALAGTLTAALPALAQPVPGPTGSSQNGAATALPVSGATANQEAVAAPEDSGLYVIVEATQRQLDGLLVLPPICTLPKANCELVESVLGNDTRLSGILRWIQAPAGLQRQVIKTPPPRFVAHSAAVLATGAVYVLASVARPSRQAGLIELDVGLVDARSGKAVELGEWAHQVSPEAGLRSMGHRVMNGVYGALTGTEGSFDTVIYYSSPAPGCNRCIWQVDADGFNRHVIVSDPGIHLFPVQFLDGGLGYTSFRGGLPSLYKLDAVQLRALTDLTPVVAKPKRSKPKKTTAVVPGEVDLPEGPEPFVSGQDLQFRGCAQSVDNQLVATVNDGDQADVWQIDWAGTLSRNLTNNDADDLGPSFSPDGCHLAFVSDRTNTPQVYVMDADGGNQRRLTFTGPYNTDPDWGPTNKIAYSGLRGNAIDILTVDLEGHMQRLTPGMGRRSLEPSWSPDGGRLVYVSNEDGRGSRLWVTSADGAAREPLDVPFGQFYTPSWQRMPGKAPKKWRPWPHGQPGTP